MLKRNLEPLLLDYVNSLPAQTHASFLTAAAASEQPPLGAPRPVIDGETLIGPEQQLPAKRSNNINADGRQKTKALSQFSSLF